MKLIDRVKSIFRAEGSTMSNIGGVSGTTNSWFNITSPYDDGFQRDLTIGRGEARQVNDVYACVALIARCVMQCEVAHMRDNSSGGEDEVDNSPTARVLRIPNAYETTSGFLQNVVMQLLFDGECLVIGVEDNRFAIVAMHRLNRAEWTVYVDPETHEVFYSVNKPEMFDQPEYLIPARNCAHFKMHTPRHPLMGESPISAAALSVGIQVALSKSQLAFFTNMNRASGILSTDMPLNSDQTKQLRTAFNEQSKGWQSGQTPILTSGLKYQSVSLSQTDSQLVEQQRLATSAICKVFGVPITLMSDSTGGTQGGTEAIISHFLSTGLGAVIECVEDTLERFFRLPASESIELDPTPLLRTDMAARAEALVKMTQGGLMTPNEARAREDYGKMSGGDQLYMQRQMTGLEQLTALNQADLAMKLNPPAPVVTTEPKDAPEPTKSFDDLYDLIKLTLKSEPKEDNEIGKTVVKDLFHKKRIELTGA